MLNRDQFNPRQEYSRSGKPKKSYGTREEAESVARSHQVKYGTVARPYFSDRTGLWHVATDREETASRQVAGQIRDRARTRQRMESPILASNVRTREEIHRGTVAGMTMYIASMNPKSGRHEQYLGQIARVNRVLGPRLFPTSKKGI